MQRDTTNCVYQIKKESSKKIENICPEIENIIRKHCTATKKGKIF
jgi:hypothetical protein